VDDVAAIDVGLLVLRVVFGTFLAYHGYNKFFGRGGLSGTAKWFGGIGMKWPRWQARLAATTEVGAGLLFAAGLLTPLAAAGMTGVMFVAIVVAHWKVGFFIFEPDQGWEYCASIIAVALSVAIIGPGRLSVDHALDVDWTGWAGGLTVLLAGVGGALIQLAISYRPASKKGATAA